MIAAWMLYSTAIGALIAAAAFSGHYLCRILRLPVRAAWAGGMVVTLALSSTALIEVAAPEVPQPVPVVSASVMEQAPVAAVTSVNALAELVRRAATMAGSGVDRVYAVAASAAPGGRGLSGVWVLTSTLLFAVLGGTLLRLRMARRRWAAHRIADVPVLVSRDAGPALVGLRRPSIVVPAWLLAEPEERQRLVVQHEDEHRRAGDHVLLAAACVIVCLVPWNAALWWMLVRLRLGVELDCDARVLRRGVKPRSYGSLLLDIAGRTRSRPFGAPALADSGTHLERRLMAMTERNHTPPRMRAAVVGMSGLLLLAAACTTDLPTAAAIDEMDVEQARGRAEYVGLLLPTTQQAPLFIVDGVIVAEYAAKELAATEIGSIEIIKGPAAVQAYGERAEHGAVFIRTRSADGADAAPVDERRAFLTEVKAKAPLGEPLERAVVIRQRAAGTLMELERKVDEPESGTVEFAARAVTIPTRDVEVQTRVVELETRVPDARVREPAGADRLNRGVLRLRELQDTSPLIILDGVMMGGSFTLRSLSPESIESVEVVKGAAARSIYNDPRASNGVIRITTKPGGR